MFNIYTGTVSHTLVRKKVEVGSNQNLFKMYCGVRHLLPSAEPLELKITLDLLMIIEQARAAHPIPNPEVKCCLA